MKYTLNKINIDYFFKITFLLLIVYCLFLITKISNQMERNAEVGRYQIDPGSSYIIDTKTGELKLGKPTD